MYEIDPEITYTKSNDLSPSPAEMFAWNFDGFQWDLQ